MIVRLHHTETIAPDTVTFFFIPQGRFRYTAGEFTEVHIPHSDVDDRGDKRWFTLSSSPTDPLIAITSKFAADSSSFKRALRALVPGQHIVFSEPMGDFTLPKSKDIPIVFVGAGIGITPIYSISRWLAAAQETRPIRVFYVEQATKAAWLDFFADTYGEHFQRLGGRQAVSAPLLITASGPAADTTLFYLSGPEAMAKQLAEDLRTAGIKPHHVITDYFPGYPEDIS